MVTYANVPWQMNSTELNFVYTTVLLFWAVNNWFFLVQSFFFTIDKYATLQELQKHGAPDIVLALVGNKADLHEKREVSVQVSSVPLNQLI